MELTCMCEHFSHFKDENPTSEAHDYQQVPGNVYSKIVHGMICEDCATSHYKTFV